MKKEREKKKKRERERERQTETQRDRETGRQKEAETETETETETEIEKGIVGGRGRQILWAQWKRNPLEGLFGCKYHIICCVYKIRPYT